MQKAIMVSGTGTGVGKTLVACSLAHIYRTKGIDVGVVKPFATGDKEHSRSFRSRDAYLLHAAADSIDNDKEINPYFYPVAAAPYMAAKICKAPQANLKSAKDAVLKLSQKHDFLIIEGIGGILVPLNKNETLATFASMLGVPILIVSQPFLGSLNYTLLTILACKAYNLRIAGIIVNQMPSRPSRVEAGMPKAVEDLTGVRVLGVIKQQKRMSYEKAAPDLSRCADLLLKSIAH